MIYTALSSVVMNNFVMNNFDCSLNSIIVI